MDNLHRPLKVATSGLNDILYHREQRYVGAPNSLPIRRQIDHPRAQRSLGEPTGKYPELYDFTNRPLEARWKRSLSSLSIFSKDQCVNHTAIVVNQRLGPALALLKAQQHLKYAPKVLTNNEKTAL